MQAVRLAATRRAHTRPTHCVCMRATSTRCSSARRGCRPSGCVPVVRCRRGSDPASRSPELPARAHPCARRQLAVGSYVFAASHEGMFGGRDFAYVRVVAPGEPVTPISRRATTPCRRSRTRCLRSRRPSSRRLRPPARSLASGAAWRGRRLCGRSASCSSPWPRLSEAVAQRCGWSPGLFRAYYLCGRCADRRLARCGLRVAAAAARAVATCSPAHSRSQLSLR